MDINGTWVNQNGSTVEFEVSADGEISGAYSSRKGRAASGLKYPITGRQNGDLVAFHVDWHDADTNLHAITSFTGRCTTDSGVAPNQWLALVVPILVQANVKDLAWRTTRDRRSRTW